MEKIKTWLLGLAIIAVAALALINRALKGAAIKAKLKVLGEKEDELRDKISEAVKSVTTAKDRADKSLSRARELAAKRRNKDTDS